MYYNLNANISFGSDTFSKVWKWKLLPKQSQKVYLGLMCMWSSYNWISILAFSFIKNELIFRVFEISFYQRSAWFMVLCTHLWKTWFSFIGILKHNFWVVIMRTVPCNRSRVSTMLCCKWRVGATSRRWIGMKTSTFGYCEHNPELTVGMLETLQMPGYWEFSFWPSADTVYRLLEGYCYLYFLRHSYNKIADL